MYIQLFFGLIAVIYCERLNRTCRLSPCLPLLSVVRWPWSLCRFLWSRNGRCGQKAGGEKTRCSPLWPPFFKNNNGKAETNMHLSLSSLVSPQVNSDIEHTLSARFVSGVLPPTVGQAGEGRGRQLQTAGDLTQAAAAGFLSGIFLPFRQKCWRTVSPLSACLRTLRASFSIDIGYK